MLVIVHELACILATIYLNCAEFQPSNLSVGLLLTPSCSMAATTGVSTAGDPWLLAMKDRGGY